MDASTLVLASFSTLGSGGVVVGVFAQIRLMKRDKLDIDALVKTPSDERFKHYVSLRKAERPLFRRFVRKSESPSLVGLPSEPLVEGCPQPTEIAS